MTDNLLLFTYKETETFRINIKRKLVTISHAQRRRDDSEKEETEYSHPSAGKAFK